MTVRAIPFAATVLVLLTAAACGGSTASDVTQDPTGTATGAESTESLTTTSDDGGAPCDHGKKGDERGHQGKHGGRGHGHGHGHGHDGDDGPGRGHPGPGDKDNDNDGRGN